MSFCVFPCIVVVFLYDGIIVIFLSDTYLFIRYSSLALLISYEVNAVECQRLAALQGFLLLIFSGDSDPERPSFSIYSSSGEGEPSSLRAKREAVLVIRGTHTIQDVVTDLRATPIVFPPSKEDIDGILSGRVGIHDCNSSLSPTASSTEKKLFAEEIGWTAPAKGIEYACRGIARAALFILAEAGPSMIELYQTGHDIKIIGHSLGVALHFQYCISHIMCNDFAYGFLVSFSFF